MDCTVHCGYRIETLGAAGGYDKHANSLQYRGRGARTSGGNTSPQSIILINQSDSEVKLKQIDDRQNLNIPWNLLRALKLGLLSLKCYRRGRDALKLSAKRIIKELRVVMFQVNKLRFHFGNFGNGLFLLKSRAKSLY